MAMMNHFTRAEIKAYQYGLQTLVDLHKDVRSTTNSPRDTANLLVDYFGYEQAAEAVAVAILCKGEWDGRISTQNREWADEVMAGFSDIVNCPSIYYPHEIHPAHLDMIADAMRKLSA